MPKSFKEEAACTGEANCLTILGTVALFLVLSFLSGCTPKETTNNNYQTNENAGRPGQTSMNGGGGGGGGGATGDGGGGQGIRCGSSKNADINNRLFVRDVYEAVFNHRLKMKNFQDFSSDDVAAESIGVLVESLKKYFGPASKHVPVTNEKFWLELIKRISFLDEDRVLQPSSDANSPIALPPECQMVQIAYWEEASGRAEDGTLYINRKLWNELDQLNRVALLAHEYFFFQARKAQYKNSDAIRKKVGQLLSVDGLEPLFKHWHTSEREQSEYPENLNGFKYCEGTSVEETTAKLKLIQYAGTDGRQYFVFPEITSTFINIDVLQKQNLSWLAKEQDSLSATTNFLLFQTAFHEKTNYLSEEKLKLYAQAYEKVQLDSSSYSVEQINWLGSLPKEVWTGTLLSSPIPITVSFLNPAHDSRVVKSPLRENASREELIHAVFEFADYMLSGARVRKKRILAAIGVLNKEIRDMVDQGKYDPKFPEWSKALDNLGPASQYGPFLSDVNELRALVPVALYTLFLNNYDRASLTELMSLFSYSIDENKPLPLGQLLMRQGSKSITFDLSCTSKTEPTNQENKIESLFNE